MVSAIYNIISCKLHKFENDEDMKMNMNKLLPEDVKIFSINFFNLKRLLKFRILLMLNSVIIVENTIIFFRHFVLNLNLKTY